MTAKSVVPKVVLKAGKRGERLEIAGFAKTTFDEYLGRLKLI